MFSVKFVIDVFQGFDMDGFELLWMQDAFEKTLKLHQIKQLIVTWKEFLVAANPYAVPLFASMSSLFWFLRPKATLLLFSLTVLIVSILSQQLLAAKDS